MESPKIGTYIGPRIHVIWSPKIGTFTGPRIHVPTKLEKGDRPQKGQLIHLNSNLWQNLTLLPPGRKKRTDKALRCREKPGTVGEHQPDALADLLKFRSLRWAKPSADWLKCHLPEVIQIELSFTKSRWWTETSRGCRIYRLFNAYITA